MVWGQQDHASLINKTIIRLTNNDPTLDTIHFLSCRSLSQPSLVQLFNSIHTTKSITSLLLSGHTLQQSALAALADAISKNTSIRTWSFGNKSFNDKDLAFLAPSIKHNTAMHKLDMEYKSLTGEAAASWLPTLLQHSSLRILNLSRNELTDATFASLFDHVPRITLHKLELTDNKLGEASAQFLSKFLRSNSCDVSEVSFAYNSIGIKGGQCLGEALIHNTTLQTLKLSGCNIGLEGFLSIMASLEENTSIQSLWLNECDINLIDLDSTHPLQVIYNSLKKNTTLQQLHLRGNKLGDEGIQSLTRALCSIDGKVDGLLHLDVGNCAFGDLGASTLLFTPTTLVKLSMIQNKLSDKVFYADITSALIDSWTPPASPSTATPSAPSPTQESSQIRLESLDIGMNAFSKEGMTLLCSLIAHGKFPKLKLLEVGGNPFTKDENTSSPPSHSSSHLEDLKKIQDAPSWETYQKHEQEHQFWTSQMGDYKVQLMF